METLQPELDPARLTREATIRSFNRNWWQRALYRLSARLRLRLGGYLLQREVEAFVNPFNAYKQQMIANTDFRKFDDMLREVLSGTEAQNGNS